MSTILFTSLSSVRAHQRLGAVRWDLHASRPSRRASCSAAWLASERRRVRRWLKGQRAGAGLQRSSSPTPPLQMLLDKQAAARRAQLPGPLRASRAWASASGFISSLVGAGGAFHVGALHDLVQCAAAPCSGHERGAGLSRSPLAGTLGYVISGWGLPASPAGGRGLPVAAGPGADRVCGQRDCWHLWARAPRSASTSSCSSACLRRCCCSRLAASMLAARVQ